MRIMSRIKIMNPESTIPLVRQVISFTAWTLALALIVGCGTNSPKPAPQAVATKNAPQASAAATEEKPPATDLIETVSQAKEEQISTLEIEKQPLPERILLLTPGGPLVVDVSFTIAGQSHNQAIQALIERVLAAADTDSDGRPTWQEWKDNTEFFQQELDEAANYNMRQIDQWIETYDENYDKQMQPAEAAAWLGRNDTGIARAFAVRSSRSYVAQLASSSRIWQLLDLNYDDVLSEPELQHAPTQFWLLDANDDRTITASELASLRDQLEMADGQLFQTNQSFGRYAAIHLDASFERDSLDPLLSDLYAPRQNLSLNSFPDLPELFAKLDADQNEWLSTHELAKLFHLDPMLKLSIAFNPADDSRGKATIQVDSHSAEVSLTNQPADDRVVLALGNTRLIISAHNLVAKLDPDSETDIQLDQAVQQSQIRLMVHDQCDTLFQELDTNGDRRLGERELQSSSERLLQHDANNDQAITSDELPYPMIVAFIRGEPRGQKSFYIPNGSFPNSIASNSENKKTPLWFQQADFNADGDLSRREFLGSDERFSILDQNTDGYIDQEEAAAFEPTQPNPSTKTVE